MRIFVASLGCTGRKTEFSYWKEHLEGSLLDMGHEVVTSDIDWDHVVLQPEQAEDRALRSERLLEQVRKEHFKAPIDLFFSYLQSSHLHPSAIRQIGQWGIPTVLFFCDSLHSFDLIREIAPSFHLCWVAEADALPIYQRAGATAIHLPMAANPKNQYPVDSQSRDIEVLFAGRLYADRATHLARLVRRQIPITVHTPDLDKQADSIVRSRAGQGWKEIPDHWRKHGGASLIRAVYRKLRKNRDLPVVAPFCRGAVFGTDLLRVIGRSQAVLNFCVHYLNNEPGGRATRYAKLRDFELPMCRTLYFPEHVRELELYFEPGKEILSWRSTSELIDKLNYYRRHPSEADTIREAGYRRALNEHQWAHRFDRLFRELGLNLRCASLQS